jgi:hypothetical protein
MDYIDAKFDNLTKQTQDIGKVLNQLYGGADLIIINLKQLNNEVVIIKYISISMITFTVIELLFLTLIICYTKK